MSCMYTSKGVDGQLRRNKNRLSPNYLVKKEKRNYLSDKVWTSAGFPRGLGPDAFDNVPKADNILFEGCQHEVCTGCKGVQHHYNSMIPPPPNPKAILQAAELMKPSFQQLSLHGLSVS